MHNKQLARNNQNKSCQTFSPWSIGYNTKKRLVCRNLVPMVDVDERGKERQTAALETSRIALGFFNYFTSLS